MRAAYLGVVARSGLRSTLSDSHAVFDDDRADGRPRRDAPGCLSSQFDGSSQEWIGHCLIATVGSSDEIRERLWRNDSGALRANGATRRSASHFGVQERGALRVTLALLFEVQMRPACGRVSLPLVPAP